MHRKLILPSSFAFIASFFFFFWTSSRLYFSRKVFEKAFGILGLDQRKGNGVVKQDLYGSFQVNVTFFEGAVSRNSAKLGNDKMPVKLRET